MGILARAASGLLSGTYVATARGVVVTLTALARVSQYCAPPVAYPGVCGGLSRHGGRLYTAVVGLLCGRRHARGVLMVLGSMPPCVGPPVVRVALV